MQILFINIWTVHQYNILPYMPEVGKSLIPSTCLKIQQTSSFSNTVLFIKQLHFKPEKQRNVYVWQRLPKAMGWMDPSNSKPMEGWGHPWILIKCHRVGVVHPDSDSNIFLCHNYVSVLRLAWKWHESVPVQGYLDPLLVHLQLGNEVFFLLYCMVRPWAVDGSQWLKPWGGDGPIKVWGHVAPNQ